MSTIAIRRLHPNDPSEELDACLRRAVAAFAHRRDRGECFVAIADGRVVGVIVLRTASRDAAIRWCRDPAVARIQHLTVAPSHQGQGIGQALLHAAEAWARCRRHLHLAVDTPAAAWDLHSFYRRRGFVLADTVEAHGWPGRSVVLTKAFSAAGRRGQGLDVVPTAATSAPASA